MSDELFQVDRLEKRFRARTGGLLSALNGEKKHLKAVDSVSFEINQGEFVGLAGQSGCGKSTLGELLLRLQEPSSGEIKFKGEDITEYGSTKLKQFRRQCQPIFQDPYESLNPRYTVSRCVKEPLIVHDIGDREEREARMIAALEDCGLRPAENYIDKFPNELSGGERQRVSIARAVVLEPDFLVADEPVSMLDVSIRASILNLFLKLKEERDLTMLYISHNLDTINYLTEKCMIMYLGNIVEIGPTNEVIHDPAHPYTDSLIKAAPDITQLDSNKTSGLEGEIPDPIDLPTGCRFQSSCEYAQKKCYQQEPKLDTGHLDHTRTKNNRKVACYYPVSKTKLSSEN